MCSFDELTWGQERRVKKLLDFADRILKVSLLDPTYGGYVEASGSKEFIEVVYIFNGRIYRTVVSGYRPGAKYY
ncbi:MAG: hypothetical protein ACO2ZP_04975 [Bacteriovoracaceae bacterium]